MAEPAWSCALVPGWIQEKCCPYCHASGERSFTFQIKGEIKRLCCKYSLAFIQLHSKEEIIFLDNDLLLDRTPVV